MDASLIGTIQFLEIDQARLDRMHRREAEKHFHQLRLIRFRTTSNGNEEQSYVQEKKSNDDVIIFLVLRSAFAFALPSSSSSSFSWSWSWSLSVSYLPPIEMRIVFEEFCSITIASESSLLTTTMRPRYFRSLSLSFAAYQRGSERLVAHLRFTRLEELN